MMVFVVRVENGNVLRDGGMRGDGRAVNRDAVCCA